MALIEVKVPDIGDFKDVAIIEVLVKVGDTIKAEQSLLTVESDKASMEIPSSHAGVVKELKVALGDKINEGTVVVMLEVAGAVAAAPAPAPVAAAATVAPPPQPSPAGGGSHAASVSGPVEVFVPDIGDFDEVAVIELLVKVGDTVAAEQSLITVESDKASMEIPSSHAGVVKELKVGLGDKVKKGSLVVVLEGTAGAAVTLAVNPPPAGEG
jgi:pyruvate dehydrogenase E2 component (dihydrolipoamide acetyltransferase)